MKQLFEGARLFGGANKVSVDCFAAGSFVQAQAAANGDPCQSSDRCQDMRVARRHSSSIHCLRTLPAIGTRYPRCRRVSPGTMRTSPLRRLPKLIACRFNQQALIDTTPLPDDIPKVKELGASSAPLLSASYFIGARCQAYNDDYMMCKTESNGRGEFDCMKEGRKVTRCAASV